MIKELTKFKNWQNAGKGIADFTQGMMDAVNNEHPVMGRVGQYGAYIIPGSAGLKAVSKVAGPATTVGGNMARAAGVEGAIGASTTAGDAETRALAGGFGALGGAVGAKLGGKGALGQAPTPGTAPSVPPTLQVNPAKQAVAQTVQETPNAVSSGFARQLKGSGESFSATKTTAQSAGVNVDDATLIANRAQEIQANAAANGIKMPASSAKKQASEELAGYNTQIASEQKAVKAKADAEARAAREAQAAQKSQEEAAKKAAFEASPEGIAAKQAQEAQVAAKAQADADSKAKAQQIAEMVRNRMGPGSSSPSVPTASPILNKPKQDPAELLAQIRARGTMGEAPSVPANMPAPAPVAKTPSPALTKTREALAKQAPDDMPTGMGALSEITNPKVPASLETIRAKLKNQASDPETQALINKQAKNYESRSIGQQERRDLEKATKDYAYISSKKNVRTVNESMLKEFETQKGIALDWVNKPNISKMGHKEAQTAIKDWMKDSVKRYDPAKPFAKKANPAKDLFGIE